MVIKYDCNPEEINLDFRNDNGNRNGNGIDNDSNYKNPLIYNKYLTDFDKYKYIIY